MCLALTCARIHTSTYWTSVSEGVAELGKLSFALAYAGDAEHMRLPDNRKALHQRIEASHGEVVDSDDVMPAGRQRVQLRQRAWGMSRPGSISRDPVLWPLTHVVL